MNYERYFQTLLKAELAERLNSNNRYSLRAFAKYLDVDASALSRILNGQKIPTPAISKKIVSKLNLTPKETKTFLGSMAQAYEEEGIQRKKAEIKELLKKPREKTEYDLTPDIFRIISDWYHYAILQLMEEKDFKFDPRYISTELGISEIEAKLAIDRMVKLELIEIRDRKLMRTSGRLTTTNNLNMTSSALRKRIKQVSEKSINSLENDPIELRNHTTMTMAIDPAKIPIAKDMIQDFMDQLSDVLQSDKKKVYELQINLFPLQRIDP